MTTIVFHGLAAPVAVTDPSPATTSVQASADLLPEPMAGADAATQLYAILAAATDAQTEFGKTKVEFESAVKKKALEDYMDALHKQQEANKGGFLSKLGLDEVAKVATVVVAVAAIAVTGGSSLVVAGILLSAGGMAVEKSKCFGDASKWVGLGASLGGGVMTGIGVASYASNATQMAETVATANQVGAASAAAASGGGFASGAAGVTAHAASAADTTAKTFLQVAEGCSAVAEIGVGAEHAESAVNTYRADEAGRNATEAQQRVARFQRLIEDTIDELKEAREPKQKGNERLSEIKETEMKTMMIAATGGKA